MVHPLQLLLPFLFLLFVHFTTSCISHVSRKLPDFNDTIFFSSSNLIRSDFKNVVHFLKIRNKRESEAEDLNKNLEVVEKIEPEVKSRNKRNYFSWYPFPGFGSPNTGYGLPNTGFYSSPVPSTPFQYPGSVTGFSHTLSHSHYNLPSTPSYQVVIPVFGGQIPIFWPQKPIYYNPGYPSHNRPRPERPVSQTNNTGKIFAVKK